MKLSKEQFLELIDLVDRGFSEQEMMIPLRPLLATIEIFKKYSTSGPLVVLAQELTYPVHANNLAAHTAAWYKTAYRETIKIDFSIARFPILIEGHVYLCKVPKILSGTFHIIASRGKINERQVINPLDMVVDLPEYVRTRLSDELLGSIEIVFACAGSAAQMLKGTVLLDAARADADASCDSLIGNKPSPSQSAWHSLQLVEKVLKQLIAKYERPQRTHNISKLIGTAEKHGFILYETIRLEFFEFGPAVRYEPDQISLAQAININHEAWKLAYNVLEQL